MHLLPPKPQVEFLSAANRHENDTAPSPPTIPNGFQQQNIDISPFPLSILPKDRVKNRFHSEEETAEVLGIAEEAGMDMQFLLGFNLLEYIYGNGTVAQAILFAGYVCVMAGIWPGLSLTMNYRRNPAPLLLQSHRLLLDLLFGSRSSLGSTLCSHLLFDTVTPPNTFSDHSDQSHLFQKHIAIVTCTTYTPEAPPNDNSRKIVLEPSSRLRGP
ncbi:hypothetical protein RUND412_002128 [Rhizina undulata]